MLYRAVHAMKVYKSNKKIYILISTVQISSWRNKPRSVAMRLSFFRSVCGSSTLLRSEGNGDNIEHSTVKIRSSWTSYKWQTTPLQRTWCVSCVAVLTLGECRCVSAGLADLRFQRSLHRQCTLGCHAQLRQRLVEFAGSHNEISGCTNYFSPPHASNSAPSCLFPDIHCLLSGYAVSMTSEIAMMWSLRPCFQI